MLNLEFSKISSYLFEMNLTHTAHYLIKWDRNRKK